MILDRFKRKPKVKQFTAVEMEIERLHSELLLRDPASTEYATVEERLKKLYEIRDLEVSTANKQEKKPIIPKEVQGPIVTGLFTLAAIGATKMLEFDGPITTKGWSLIPKGRV